MQQLTPAGDQAIQDLSRRYGVSTDAVRALLDAVSAGGGSMAQFYHPDLGGNGQWMRGGMTMVGDMFNSGLQSTVNGLCNELSSLLASQTVYAPAPQGQGGGAFGGGFMASGNNWWPGDLGSPSSSGGQNDARYAVFPQTRRLAISRNGQVTIYDTLDHNIGGVQQQQGGWPGSVTFNSQYGSFGVESLPIISGGDGGGNAQPAAPAWNAPDNGGFQNSSSSNFGGQQQSQSSLPFGGQQQMQSPGGYAPAPAPAFNPASAWNDSSSGGASSSGSGSAGGGNQADILATIERMAELHRKGILSDDEFSAKKAELLSRL